MIKIIETPRDATQGIKTFIPKKNKIAFINALLKVGYYAVDVGSFVSPKAIPQMADTDEVLKSIDISGTKSKIMVTIANLRGAQRAMDFDIINEIAFPYSVSEEFLRRNINSDKPKTLDTIEQILKLCEKHNKELILYNSMAFGNGYGEPWSPELVVEDMKTLVNMGVKTVILSDTVDIGQPENINLTFQAVNAAFSQIEIGAHLHTTEKDWYQHLKPAYENNCRRFDAVINGMGGCPMSGHKLIGNLATTHLLEFLKEYNAEFMIDQQAFNKALFMASTLVPI